MNNVIRPNPDAWQQWLPPTFNDPRAEVWNGPRLFVPPERPRAKILQFPKIKGPK